MLSRDGTMARFILAICFFFASGSGLVSGWPGALCGVLGTVELASAILKYSPLTELISWWQSHKPSL